MAAWGKPERGARRQSIRSWMAGARLTCPATAIGKGIELPLSPAFLERYVHFIFGQEHPEIDAYLREVAALGVRHVFLRAEEIAELRPEACVPVARVATTLAESRLQVHTVHARFGGPFMLGATRPDGRAEALRVHEETLRAAASLGSDNVVFHLEAAYSPEAEAAARAVLDRLLAVAEAERVRLALEVLSPGCYGSRIEHLSVLLEQYASPWLGICLDFGHAHLAGTLAEWIDAMAAHIFTLHLHDNDGTRDQHQPPGCGTLEWPAMLDQLRRAGYRGPLVSEARTPAGWDSARLIEQFETVCGPWAAPEPEG